MHLGSHIFLSLTVCCQQYNSRSTSYIDGRLRVANGCTSFQLTDLEFCLLMLSNKAPTHSKIWNLLICYGWIGGVFLSMLGYVTYSLLIQIFYATKKTRS